MRSLLAWLNAALALPAFAALTLALRGAFATGHGEDLQWSGARLTLRGIDPYRQYLLHDPSHAFLMTQVPNYLHEFYLLLLPLGALSLSTAKPLWALFNCLFAALTLLMLRRIYALDTQRTLLLTLLLLISFPFHVVLSNGQNTFLELLFICSVFYTARPLSRGLALGLSYFKYSFSPVLVLYLLLQRQYRTILVAIIPPLLGLLGMWLVVHGSLARLAIEPLLVSRTGVTAGSGDLMTLLQMAFHSRLTPAALATLTYAVAFLASGACAFVLSRRRDLPPHNLLAALGVASLLFFTHLGYDYVFLILPLANCVRSTIDRYKLVTLTIIAWLWYGMRAVPASIPWAAPTMEAATFLLLVALFLLSLRTRLSSPTGRRTFTVPAPLYDVPSPFYEMRERLEER